MALELNEALDKQLKDKSRIFVDKLESEMDFKSELDGDLMSFDWVDEIEFACPYIDIIVRNPKLTLIQEENLVKVERSKRINETSVKDLAKHTQNIAEVNENDEVRPSKILDIRNEETYNIYENRFLYTLINDLTRFVLIKEKLLDNFEMNNNKLLEYRGASKVKNEKINIELKVTSNTPAFSKDDKKLAKEIAEIKKRIKKIKDYLSSWERSEMVKSLEKEHVNFVKPPLKKTNILLKNPNFKIAVRLWDIIRTYDYNDNEDSREGKENNAIMLLQGFLDHSFLIDYFVLDSLVSSKREQKSRMAKYALIILAEEIEKILKLLASNGVEITDEELLALVAKALKEEKKERLAGMEDVKKKFKNAMEEYLERTQEYL